MAISGMIQYLIVGVFIPIFSSLLSAETINLEQARTLALSSSRSLAKINQSIRNSVLDVKSQLFNMLPSVSAEYRASMNYLDNWELISKILISNFNSRRRKGAELLLVILLLYFHDSYFYIL